MKIVDMIVNTIKSNDNKIVIGIKRLILWILELSALIGVGFSMSYVYQYPTIEFFWYVLSIENIEILTYIVQAVGFYMLLCRWYNQYMWSVILFKITYDLLVKGVIATLVFIKDTIAKHLK